MFVSEAAALLAHDLNNGLSIANANLQFLDEELELDGDLADAMAGSQRALHRMSTLVRNFVDISRLEDDAIQPQRTQVDIDELLHTVAGSTITRAPAAPGASASSARRGCAPGSTRCCSSASCTTCSTTPSATSTPAGGSWSGPPSRAASW
jgi:hypothetical protein